MRFTLEKKTVLLLVVLVVTYVLSKTSVDVERKYNELVSKRFASIGGEGNGV